MSYYKKVQNALDTRLAALSGGTPIAWENVEYRPTAGTAYLRPTLLLGTATLFDLSSVSMQENTGIYQIDLFYPVGNGPGAILTKMDAIYDHFKGSTPLSSGGTSVYIKQISRIIPAIRERQDSWYIGSIEIVFRVYDN